MKHQRAGACPAPSTNRLREGPARGQPVAPRQHVVPRYIDCERTPARPEGQRWWGRWIRRPDGCGPCDGATPEWRDRRGCASADGNRASCGDDGCSAGTYACSRVGSPGVGGGSRPVLGPGLGDCKQLRLAPPTRGEPPLPARVSGSWSLSVDMRHRSTPVRPFNGTRCAGRGQTEATPRAVAPVAEQIAYHRTTDTWAAKLPRWDDLCKPVVSRHLIAYDHLWTTA